jgi:amino acid transporter
MDQSSNYHVLSNFGISVAVIMLLAITTLNVLTIKFIGKITTVIGSWKVIVPLLTAAVIILAKFDIHNFWQFSGFSPNGIHGILMAVSSVVIFSFLGFREATSLAGEAKNPQKAIPVAVIGSVCICLLLYLVLQIAFIGSLNIGMLDAGWSKIHFSGDFGPFAGIATTLGLAYLSYLIYLDSVVSPLGTGFTYTTTTARINYAMSKNKYTPSSMLKLNENGIPINAIIFNFIIGIVLLLPFPEWEELIKFQSVAIVMAYGSGPIALLALRAQKPELNRPFKVLKPKIFAFITLYVCNLITYWTGFGCIWRLMIALLAGIILLLCYRLYNKDDMYPIHMFSACWIFLHFIGITIISYLGSFEGIGVISFGTDFAVIAIFSAIVLALSQYCKLPEHEVTIMLDNIRDEIKI